MKRDGTDPKVDGDELGTNVDVDAGPKMEGAADEAGPKGLAEDVPQKFEDPYGVVVVGVPKPELLKVEVLGPNRLVDVEEVKGLADDCPRGGEGANGLDGAASAPKPIAPVD